MSADAIYEKSENMLYFKKISAISGIFNGVSELYREATKEETVQFLSNKFVRLGDDYNEEMVGTPNRKRIALAVETLNEFSKKEKSLIFSYIKDYCPSLSFNENESNFSIQSEEDLKYLLWGIEQRYYTTPVGKEKRVANSVSEMAG